MNSLDVQGKVLNSPRSSSNETYLFEIKHEPQNLEYNLPELNVLGFGIEACNPPCMPLARQDPIIIISFSSNQGFQKVLSTKKSSLDLVELVRDERVIKKILWKP